jgi:hypothetical protein
VTDLDATRGQDRPIEDVAGSEAPAGSMLETLPALRELSGALLAAETVEGVLGRVVVAARHVIPGADLVSITVRREDGSLVTPTGTGAEAVDLDQAQYRTENGPCVDAADPAGPAYALSNDLAHETAWPTFAASAIAHGYHSVLATALLPDPDAVPFTAALNVYSRRTEAFDDSARDLAFLLSTHASLALALTHSRGTVGMMEDLAVHLRQAVESHTVIGQATGVLMARRGLTADQAFDVLKRTSQNRNIKLSRLATLLTDEPRIADRL